MKSDRIGTVTPPADESSFTHADAPHRYGDGPQR
jgi:hypothetical protein